MSAAVVLCLDRNKLVEQEQGPPAWTFYEAEAVRCVRSWRKRAKWDGAIYAVQYEGRTVAKATQDALRNMDVMVATLGFSAPKRSFMDVVQALAWAESGGIAEDRIVYSDLDVAMTSNLPAEFMEAGTVVLYHYVSEDQRGNSPEFSYRMARGRERGYLCHNTYFQAFDRGCGFQGAVLQAASTMEYLEFFRDNVYYAPTDDDYFFEEGLYDFVCTKNAERFSVLDFPCPGEFFIHKHATAKDLTA